MNDRINKSKRELSGLVGEILRRIDGRTAVAGRLPLFSDERIEAYVKAVEDAVGKLAEAILEDAKNDKKR